MQIAVLGTGSVGRALAGRLAGLGHTVTVGTRDPAATLARAEPDPMGTPPFASWHAEHPDVAVAAFDSAAAGAEVVVNATSGQVTLEVLGLVGPEHLAGTVLMDVANPLDFSHGFPPTLAVKDTDSLAEQVQRAHPGARVVKTLNTMNADVMVHPDTVAGGDHTVFVSGDDAAAKQTVTDLLTAMGHTDVLDLGDLASARGAEMLLPLWLRVMGSLGTARFQFKVVR